MKPNDRNSLRWRVVKLEGDLQYVFALIYKLSERLGQQRNELQMVLHVVRSEMEALDEKTEERIQERIQGILKRSEEDYVEMAEDLARQLDEIEGRLD